MKKEIKIDLLLVFLLALFLLIFFYPVLFGGQTFVTSGVTMSDLMNQNYPFKVVYAEALKQGRLPFWVANMGDGFPLLAEGQVGAFYPFNLLFFYFLPPLLAYNLDLFFHYFLAAFFTYLLARSYLGLSPVSAAISGLTFSLSGFMMIHLALFSMIQTAVWLPLELWLIEKVLRQPKFWQAIPLGFVFTFQFLAGYAELFYFSALFLGSYVVVRLFLSQQLQKAGRVLLVLFLGTIITTLICLPQIIETLIFVKVSTRGGGMTYEAATSVLFPLRHFLTLIIPWVFDFSKEGVPPIRTGVIANNLWETYLYVGLIPLFLAILAIFLGLKKDGRVKLFIGLLIISLLLAFGRSTPLFKIFWNFVPGMNLFQYPTRFTLFTAFSLALLAGLGVEMVGEVFEKRKRGQQVFKILGLVLLLVSFVDLFLSQRRINPTMKAKDWFETPQTAKFLKENLGEYRYYTLGTSNIDYETIFDPEAQKGLQELLPSDFNLIHNLSSTTEQSAFFLDRQTKLTFDTPGISHKFNEDKFFSVPDNRVKTLSLKGARYVLSALPLKNENLVLVKEVSLPKEVPYIILQLTEGGVEVRKVPTKTVYLYENTQVLPRAFMVYQVREFKGGSEREILEIIVSSGFDPRKEVILEEEFPARLDKEGKGQARIVSYKDERVEIEVDSSANGLLVLTDNFYPAWQAFVDGEKTKIYLADFSFRAVQVPQGKHKVKFVYKPFGR